MSQLETPHVVILTSDVVGPSMAGPGIRHAALADVLGREFDVLLAAPQGSQPVPGRFRLAPYARTDWDVVRAWCDAADVLLLPGDVLLDFPELPALGKPIVIDGYDPHTAEVLLLTCGQPMAARVDVHSQRQRLLTRQCLVGDFFICAGEVQRTWWLGLLEMTGRVNPYTFAADPTLRKLVDCVPYGVPSAPLPPLPAHFRPFDLAPDDPVLLWGGGLWDWLDPLTAIRALPLVLARVSNARLLFPGTRHPSPSVPAMRMVAQARDLARSLGLLDTHVFFGDWAPRDEWPDYLQRACVGLSLHPASYETHLAFRSRLLEYIWAGLPMVVTGGDETALVVERYGLGRVVGVQDVTGVAAAILELLAGPRAAFAPAFVHAREDFTWERCAQPLIEFCRAPRLAPDRMALGEALGNPLFQHELQTLRAERNAALQARAGALTKVAASDNPSSRELQTLRAERDAALAQVAAYEHGRFIRLMRWLKEGPQ